MFSGFNFVQVRIEARFYAPKPSLCSVCPTTALCPIHFFFFTLVPFILLYVFFVIVSLTLPHLTLFLPLTLSCLLIPFRPRSLHG